MRGHCPHIQVDGVTDVKVGSGLGQVRNCSILGMYQAPSRLVVYPVSRWNPPPGLISSPTLPSQLCDWHDTTRIGHALVTSSPRPSGRRLISQSSQPRITLSISAQLMPAAKTECSRRSCLTITHAQATATVFSSMKPCRPVGRVPVEQFAMRCGVGVLPIIAYSFQRSYSSARRTATCLAAQNDSNPHPHHRSRFLDPPR